MLLTVNSANNQVAGGYDANGNALSNTGNALIYDVENHVSGAGWINGAPAINYGYDAQSKRFLLYAGTKDSSGNPSGYSVVAYSPSGQKLGMYQISTCNTATGNQLALTICDSLTTSDQYFGGRRLASMDQLGSVGTYYPWGEAKGTTNPQDTWSYATYWRDSVTGLDYANNRYYSNAYGRFMTPDPYTNSGRLNEPQSWNRYAYTAGDPVNRLDPGGRDYIPPEECFIAGIYDASIGCGEGFDADFISLSGPGPITPHQIVSYARQIATAAAGAWLLVNESRVSANTSIPTYLAMKSECWYPDSGPGNTQSSSYTLFVTYQILNQNGQPMSGAQLSGVSISESITTLPKSAPLSAGPPWEFGTATGIQDDGTFTDLLSSNSLANFNNYIGALQAFSASGTVGGVPFYQPLQVMGFGPTTSVLQDYFGPTSVTINGLGLGTNPATKCNF